MTTPASFSVDVCVRTDTPVKVTALPAGKYSLTVGEWPGTLHLNGTRDDLRGLLHAALGALADGGPQRHEVLHNVRLLVCDLCIGGAGGECHVPGCAFWMSAAPDVPLTPMPPSSLEAFVADCVSDCVEGK